MYNCINKNKKDMRIVKSGKGHNVFINGQLVMWVIGSKANAIKEVSKLA